MHHTPICRAVASFRPLSLAAVCLALALGGCGGGGAPIAGNPDLAGGTPDMAPSAPPTFIAGDFRRYVGSTVDGWAVVIDGAGSAWAIKLADGAKRHVADHVASAWAYLDAIFVDHDVLSGSGGLELWHGDGPAVHLDDLVPDNMFGFSPPVSDGAGHVTYYHSTGTNSNDLVLDTVDHTSRRVLLSGVDLTSSSSCWPTLRFFAGRLLVEHCAGDGVSKTLSSYDVAGGAAVDLATGVAGFSPHKGVGVLVTTTAGALTLVAADGSGAAVPLASDARSARFAPDGASAFVVTTAGALERIAIADHAVTTLQPSGVTRLGIVSGDGHFATFARTTDPTTFLDDLWLTDARTAGPATALSATSTTSSFGYGFTDDSAFALYLVDVDPNTIVGSLRVKPVDGGAERVIAAGSDSAAPFGKSRISYTENETGTYPDTRADLSVIDLAGGAPTKVATQAHNNYDVFGDTNMLVYVQPGEGLHLAKLP